MPVFSSIRLSALPPSVITGEVDVLPRVWRQVLQEIFIHGLAVALDRLQGHAHINGLPKDDRSRDKIGHEEA